MFHILVVFFLIFCIASVLSYRVGQQKERWIWYKFLRDDLRTDNAANIQAFAKALLTAQEKGVLLEFKVEMEKELVKQSFLE